MRYVWPFKIREPLIESLEWATDVFRAKAGEQRLALRTSPRRIFSFDHVFTDQEYSYARTLIRLGQGADGFYVPDWSQPLRLGSVSAGTGIPITEDVSYLDIGERALLWGSKTQYEVVEYVDDSNGPKLAEVQGSYSDARLVPLWEGFAPEGLSTARGGARISISSIEFIVTENEDLSDSDYPQYREHDVVTTCPVIGSGDFSENIVWPVTTFDNLSSSPYYLRQRSMPDNMFQMRWHEFSRRDIWELRRWLHSRRGRQKVFWLSSRAKDLEPADDISGTTVTVFSTVGLRPPPYDIDVTENDGTSSYRQVTDVVAGTPIGGRQTVDLTIDSSLAVSLSDIKRISYLRCARFDSDRIELEHGAAAGTSVSVPCIEVPVP